MRISFSFVLPLYVFFFYRYLRTLFLFPIYIGPFRCEVQWLRNRAFDPPFIPPLPCKIAGNALSLPAPFSSLWRSSLSWLVTTLGGEFCKKFCLSFFYFFLPSFLWLPPPDFPLSIVFPVILGQNSGLEIPSPFTEAEVSFPLSPPFSGILGARCSIPCECLLREIWGCRLSSVLQQPRPLFCLFSPSFFTSHPRLLFQSGMCPVGAGPPFLGSDPVAPAYLDDFTLLFV